MMGFSCCLELSFPLVGSCAKQGVSEDEGCQFEAVCHEDWTFLKD